MSASRGKPTSKRVEVAKEAGVITVALAGNPNVGKSVIFNQLTGASQFVANWPGKTVEIAEGRLYHAGRRMKVVDLPGIYSISAFSAEEVVARDYILLVKPDVVVDVIDATALERNLYLTLQLIELDAPLIVVLNQVDLAAKKGIEIDAEGLSRILSSPVVKTVAVTGKGIRELVSLLTRVAHEGGLRREPRVRYGREVEEEISAIQEELQNRGLKLLRTYPARWVAIKLLEGDEDVKRSVMEEDAEVLKYAEERSRALEEIHGEPASVILASERYSVASRIAKEVVKPVAEAKVALTDKVDSVLMHKAAGYLTLALVMALTFAAVFTVGAFLEGLIGGFFDQVVMPVVEEALKPLPAAVGDVVEEGILGGVAAGVTIIVPYVSIFYLALSVLEDTGYIPRAAFLMDNLLHKLGLHGKAFIPLILGYGCNVPACLSCRIMETERERLLLSALVVMVPCAARTVVILGVVGKYVGISAALAIYVFDLLLIFSIGRLLFKTLPGEPVGLIMELPPYRRPAAKVVATKTWAKTKDFIYVAMPMIVIGSVALEAMRAAGVLDVAIRAMAPAISLLLGLPGETGIPLIFGFLRKELILVLLYEYVGSRLDLFMSYAQMITLTLVMTIYVPCVATYAAMIKELGFKRATAISISTIALAIAIGALAHRALSLFAA